MLSEILESNKKSEVLAFILMAPERGFSNKELAKRLHQSETSMQRTLREFEQLNLVKGYSRERHRFYMVNSRNKQLPDIRRSLQRNQKAQPDELFSAIKKLGEIKGAFLSGIFAGQPQLPVDILLVGKISLTKLDKFLQNCKKLMGVEINYSIMTPDEFQLRRDTFDRFMRDIFDYHHVVVVDNTKRRKK